MKRILILSIALCAMLSFSSCEKEKFVNEKAEALFPFVINASTEGADEPSTKVVLGPTTGEGESKVTTVLWAEGDSIACSKQGGDVWNDNKATIISSGAGTPYAKFEFQLPEDYIIDYIVHPQRIAYYSDGDHSMDFSLPYIQEYKPEGLSKTALPMLYVNPSTTENPGESISFRNICGVVKLSLQSTKKDIIISKIIFRSESAIAGIFDVNIDVDRKFKDLDNIINMRPTEYPEKEIKLVFEEYVTLGAEAKDFYIVVPPTESMGFEIEVQTSDFGRQIIKAPAVEANRVKRNVIKTMPTLDLEIVPREKWTDVASTGFSVGSGSVEDPYQISTPEELAFLSKNSENNENYSDGQYFKLMDDLTMAASYDDEFVKKEWTPIKNFKGVFDGNGKSVKYDYEVIDDRFALFDKNLGVIKNLIVLGRIYGEKYVAGIVVENNGTIINCANNLKIYGEDYLCGICVYSNANNRIVNSYNNAGIYVSDEKIGRASCRERV